MHGTARHHDTPEQHHHTAERPGRHHNRQRHATARATTAQTKLAPNNTTRSATQHRTHREKTQTNTTSKGKRTAERHSTAPHGNKAPQNTGHSTGERGTTTNHSTQQGSQPHGLAGAPATTHASGKQRGATRPSSEQPATTGNTTKRQPARIRQHGTTAAHRTRGGTPDQRSTAPQDRTQPRATTGDQETATGGSSAEQEPSPTPAAHTAPGTTQNRPPHRNATGNKTHRTGTTREHSTTQQHTPAHPQPRTHKSAREPHNRHTRAGRKKNTKRQQRKKETKNKKKEKKKREEGDRRRKKKGKKKSKEEGHAGGPQSAKAHGTPGREPMNARDKGTQKMEKKRGGGADQGTPGRKTRNAGDSMGGKRGKKTKKNKKQKKRRCNPTTTANRATQARRGPSKQREGQRLTPDAPHNSGRPPPPRGRPPNTPPPRHAAPTGHAAQGDSVGPPHPHTRAQQPAQWAGSRGRGSA